MNNTLPAPADRPPHGVADLPPHGLLVFMPSVIEWNGGLIAGWFIPWSSAPVWGRHELRERVGRDDDVVIATQLSIDRLSGQRQAVHDRHDVQAGRVCHHVQHEDDGHDVGDPHVDCDSSPLPSSVRVSRRVIGTIGSRRSLRPTMPTTQPLAIGAGHVRDTRADTRTNGIHRRGSRSTDVTDHDHRAAGVKRHREDCG